MKLSVFLILAVTCSHVLLTHCNESLQGKVAVVTGGAQGIGFSICKWYLKSGARAVIIVDINKTKGLEAQKILNRVYGENSTTFYHADVAKPIDTYSKIMNKFGYVDILVNNAGIADEPNPVRMMKVNAEAPMLWSYKFYEKMRKDRGGRGGSIVNLATTLAYMKVPFSSSYQCSKRVVVGLTFALGHQWNFRHSHVRVYSIAPGLTNTTFLQQKFVLPGHEKLFSDFLAIAPSQSPDAVGRGAVILHETAKTGCMYTIEGGKPPVESPDRLDLIVDYNLRLEKPKKSTIKTTPILPKRAKKAFRAPEFIRVTRRYD